ncbi:hypothetical protein GOQ29_11235 [Clostridium sp. D2Q-14]|uniref:hypothetical protein n=1 Tax=Anaeromonas gelatinilytica TaxID=2683194 RepID=UPI00193C290B|nr:hypothetical protein [Anaeromonas gelatinilytica]MBS4536189.1 hypothetical protein [Anaeromonas gelatinilytica]
MILSKREKILLYISGILLVFFIIYNFILLPQLTKLKELSSQSKELEKDLLDAETSINLIEDLDEKINLKEHKIINLTSDLFPSLQQEEILTLLDSFIKDSNIRVQSINFSEIKFDSIENNEIDKDDKNNNSNEHSDSIENNNNFNEEKDSIELEKEIFIENMSATIIYSGAYHEIIDFLSYIDNFDKNIIIKNINIIENDEEVSGDIVLDFYGIPKVNSSDKEFIHIPNSSINGKKNPFEIQ